MVKVVKEKRLSEIRSQKTSRRFPDNEYQKIISSLEQVPENTHNEDFDGLVAESLSEYEYEWDAKSGRNPKTMLWHPEFNHSVDLYHPEKRIAVEVEKAQRKRISDDILKFIRGGKTQDGGRDVIEFGCLIVPAEHPEYGNLFQHSITTLEFMRSVLHVEDIAVIGYRS